MANMVLSDCFISIDGTEFSGQNTKVAISYSASAVDVTAMGDETKKNIGGLKEWSMALEFNGDEAITGPFFGMVGTVVPVEVRPSSAVVGPNNPSYQGDALITEYTPLDGSVGDAHKVSLTVVSAGTLTRATT